MAKYGNGPSCPCVLSGWPCWLQGKAMSPRVPTCLPCPRARTRPVQRGCGDTGGVGRCLWDPSERAGCEMLSRGGRWQLMAGADRGHEGLRSVRGSRIIRLGTRWKAPVQEQRRGRCRCVGNHRFTGESSWLSAPLQSLLAPGVGSCCPWAVPASRTSGT